MESISHHIHNPLLPQFPNMKKNIMKKRRLGITISGSRKKRRLAAAASGGTTIENLGELELETILLKLSAFDLVPCKRVCKPWRCLISSDNFVKAHLNRSRSDPSCQKLLVRQTYSSGTQKGPFKSLVCFTANYMFIVGSVNGLICFVSRLSGKLPQFAIPMTPDNIWISNPITGLCRKLPSPSSHTLITPETTTSKFAFWWDPPTASDGGGGVYKVAKIVSYKNGRTMVDLWESTSPDTWTTVNATAPFHFCFDNIYGLTCAHPCNVLIPGVGAYWFVCNLRGRMFVLSLDLKTLLLESIPLPKGVSGDLYLSGGNMNGEFVLLHQPSSLSHSNMYHIWTMAKDNHSNRTRGWNKSFKICLDFPFDKYLGIMNGKLVFKKGRDTITLYDLETTRTKEVLEYEPHLSSFHMTCAHGFVGSLVSVDGFGFEYNDSLKRFMRVEF